MYQTNLLALRLRDRSTQQQVADDLGINVTVYARYERGERVLPLDLAVALAKYYDVSLDYLACNDHEVDGQEIIEAYEKGFK